MVMLATPVPGTRRAQHLIAHLSGPNLVSPGDLVLGRIDPVERLLAAFDLISAAGHLPDVLLITGDLAAQGEPAAYALLRDLLSGLRETRGIPAIVLPGDLDDLATMDDMLRPEVDTGDLSSFVHVVRGLRIVTLNSAIPGAHCGRLSRRQLDWLAGVLREPALHGTVVAMHHPPIRACTAAQDGAELINAAELGEVLAGTDVRVILAGHFHFPAFGMLGDIPVNVASSTCFTESLLEADGDSRGFDSGQSFSLVHLYSDSVLCTPVSLARERQVYFYTQAIRDRFESLDLEERMRLLELSDAERLRLLTDPTAN